MNTAVQNVCSSCGNPALPDGKFCLFCGDLLTELRQDDQSGRRPFVVSSSERSTAPRPLEYAGFWLRVWAGAIDVVLEATVALAITGIVGWITLLIGRHYGLSSITARYITGIAFILVLAIGAWLYAAFTESSNRRATVGKRIIGLQVVTSSGGKLSFGQASVRHFMKFLSLFTVAVGFLMAAWTKRHQALHDMPADCVVVRIAEPCLSLFGKQS
jgi:uncharacterized RDD family membrane protein YckC